MDLETRLRALDDGGARPATPADALRLIAGRRRRRRRLLVTAAVAAVALVTITVTAWSLTDDRGQQVTVGPPGPATTLPAPGTGVSTRTLGGLSGVEVQVTPSRDLLDGQLVDVRIAGLDRIPGAVIVLSAGDVTDATADTSCDLSTGVNGSGDLVQVEARAEQSVSVGRIIRITRASPDLNVTAPYDCAVEPAGCVLAVGPLALPARAALVPLTFQDLPVDTATATLAPSTGLRAGQEATLTAEGLRPNTTYHVTECRQGEDVSCDVLSDGTATSDGAGRLTTSTKVWASIYREVGRVDCTAEPCAAALTTAAGEVVIRAPFAFAADVVAPIPSLQLDPGGPYADGQEVTVRGTGFRPGHQMAGEIGECPADKDTATEERCGYDLFSSVGGVVVDANGRFTTTVRLTAQLAFTGSCRGGPGCVLGWVIPHGTTLAKVPLPFSP